jgi:hypothetical protein
MMTYPIVMAGLVQACPGHPRLALSRREKKDVDTRDKRGHDESALDAAVIRRLFDTARNAERGQMSIECLPAVSVSILFMPNL